MTNDTLSPRIYVACLAAYNAGRLHGRWIDAAQDADDIWTEIREMLAASPEPGAEEFAIHDYEGFAGIGIGEYDSIETVAQLAELLEEHGPALGAFYDYQPGYWADNMDALGESFEDSYRGEFSDEQEFAEQLADDIRPFSSDSPEAKVLDTWPYSYIDWERATRDLFMGDYWSARTPDFNVWVFETN